MKLHWASGHVSGHRTGRPGGCAGCRWVERSGAPTHPRVTVFTRRPARRLIKKQLAVPDCYAFLCFTSPTQCGRRSVLRDGVVREFVLYIAVCFLL